MNRNTFLGLVIAGTVLFMAFSKNKEEQEAPTGLTTYSVSLSVKDINASFEFYQKLGFKPMDGALEQNWIILTNGNTKIGLFQGMFPTNTITFNPLDARKVHNDLAEKGIDPVFTAGMENESGPCSFSITDPDGNPILIDQH